MLHKFFNLSSLVTVIGLFYVYITYQKLHQLMNPLDGVDIIPGAEMVSPHWQENATFSVLCFLSSSKRFQTFKISELKERKAILFIKHGLEFNTNLETEITMHFNITTPNGMKTHASEDTTSQLTTTTSSGGVSFLTNLFWSNPPAANVTMTSVSNKLWKLLRTNTSSVQLHVLAVKTTNADGKKSKRKVSSSRSSGSTDGTSGSSSSTGSSEVDTTDLPIDPDIEALGGLDEITAGLLKDGTALYDVINMIKWDVIPKTYAHRYLLKDVPVIGDWVKVDALDALRLSIPSDTIISYWKPEVAIRVVTDFTSYPIEHVPEAIHKHAVITAGGSKSKGSAYQRSLQKTITYKPPLHADEIGLTSDKYITLNDTVSWLPLKISYAPMALQRWLLMTTMEDSLQVQSGIGFSAKDLDDVRRLISDTSIYLLGVTMLASSLHLLFEFLAFQSDIAFWSGNKSLAGLSVRSVVVEFFSQIIVFLFLIDSDTSLLVSIPAFCAIIIQMWKVQKALGLTIECPGEGKGRWTLGYVVTCTRLQAEKSENGGDDNPTDDNDDNDAAADDGDDNDDGDSKRSVSKRKNKAVEEDEHSTVATRGKKTANGSKKGTAAPSSSGTGTHSSSDNMSSSEEISNTTTAPKSTNTTTEELTRVTLEADRIATTYLGMLLSPVILGIAIRSLIYDKHGSWYSWCIATLTGSFYTLSFTMSVPQLIINHRLKSVSALPWRYLVYKFINTFIDDLFAFIIKMPTMHRISVFRDDIIFVIYIYQRWIYRVDESRPAEK